MIKGHSFISSGLILYFSMGIGINIFPIHYLTWVLAGILDISMIQNRFPNLTELFPSPRSSGQCSSPWELASLYSLPLYCIHIRGSYQGLLVMLPAPILRYLVSPSDLLTTTLLSNLICEGHKPHRLVKI